MMQVKSKRVGATISRLFKKNPTSTVGLDIGSGAIKIAEVRWIQGQPELVAAAIEELSTNTVRDGYVLNKEKLTETLERAWALRGIKGKHVVLSLSGQAVFIRELLFPAMNDEELRQAVKWELDKYISTPDAANYYFDFAVLGSAKDMQNIRVLLVAAPLEMINGLTRAVKQAGLNPLAIDIEPLALQRTMEKANNAIVIDIGAECCQLNLFQQGSPLVSRFIPLSGGRFTEAIGKVLELNFYEAEKLKKQHKGLLTKNSQAGEVPTAVHQSLKLLVGELAREIRRTTDYYQMQNRDAFIDKVVLTGGGAQLDNLADHLSTLLAGTQMVIHAPLHLLQISPSLSLEWLQGIELQIAVAIGLALRRSDDKNGD